MKTHLNRFSMADTALILPTGPNGSVQLNIATILNLESSEKIGNLMHTRLIDARRRTLSLSKPQPPGSGPSTGSATYHHSADLNLDKLNFGYEYLAVFIKDGEVTSPTAVQGRHNIEGGYLKFTPYFPFERGMTYVVRTKNFDIGSEYSFQSFELGSRPNVEEAKVLHIYPSAAQLPENLLRFYIYFNTPMKKGEALKRIQLVDEAGNIDPHAFMGFKHELWSPDGKRLTLFFDPGRIKRGVSANMELGPALVEGNRYHLTISREWQDFFGQELLVRTAKEFRVDKAYRQSIDLNRWKISKPEAEGLGALSITFDRVMDHALIQSMIQIEGEEKNLIAGSWEIGEQERLIQFIPEKKWKIGAYKIIIDSRLEDAAGNNLQALLDQSGLDRENNLDDYQKIDFKIRPNK